MPITIKEKCALRSQSHALKPVVMIGQHGLSKTVQAEVSLNLLAHELIKIKIAAANSQERDAIIQNLLREHGAELIQRIGHVATIFRKNPHL